MLTEGSDHTVFHVLLWSLQCKPYPVLEKPLSAAEEEIIVAACSLEGHNKAII